MSKRLTEHLVKSRYFKDSPVTVVDVGVRGGFERHWDQYWPDVRLIGVEEIAHYVPTRPSGGDTSELESVAETVVNAGEQALSHLDGSALCLNVLFVNDVLVDVHEHRLGRRGSDIDPEIRSQYGIRLLSLYNHSVVADGSRVKPKSRSAGETSVLLLHHSLQAG